MPSIQPLALVVLIVGTLGVCLLVLRFTPAEWHQSGHESDSIAGAGGDWRGATAFAVALVAWLGVWGWFFS